MVCRSGPIFGTSAGEPTEHLIIRYLETGQAVGKVVINV